MLRSPVAGRLPRVRVARSLRDLGARALGPFVVGTLALGTLVLPTAGCRGGLRPADVAETSRLVALAKRDPGIPRTYLLGGLLDDRPAWPWTGREMTLARRGPAFHPRARLVADLLDARGGSTEFTVDTGTSFSCVSTFASAAATSRRDPDGTCSKFKDGSDACRATLASLAGGSLVGRDAPVLLVNRRHDLSDSTNLFGMTWLAGLAIVHDASLDRWTLVPGGTVPERPGWARVRMEAPALPVVALRGPDGRPTYGLIDTGAPTSLSEAGCAAGPYRLADTDGRMVLDLRSADVAPWRGLDPGGRRVTVWIGLRDLETRSFVMDFTTGIWSIGPAERLPARRPARR